MGAGGGIEEAVRRALGRLVSSAEVRRLPAEVLTPPVQVRVSEALQAPPLSPGRQEAQSKPSAALRRAAVPEAEVGAGEAELLPVARIAAGSQSLLPPCVHRMPVVRAETCRTAQADLDLPVFPALLPEQFWLLPPAPVRVRSAALLPAPATAPLTGWEFAPGRSFALRVPGSNVPRVRWGGDSVQSRMPLTRRSLDAPRDLPLARAFEAERERLAVATGTPLEDVLLLGVYPGIPILAVSRILVAGENRGLRLWLKPEVLRSRKPLRLITLVVGRQISGGKMIQAAL